MSATPRDDATPPVISVVVPVYNAAPRLARCLDSILMQDCRDLEVVAIDDGSTDGSKDVLAERARIDARVRVLRHATGANRGVAATRNLGVREARGEYLCFVDADDRLRPRALGALLAAARGGDADVVAFNGEERGDARPPAPIHRQPKPTGVVSGEDWVAWLCRQNEWRHFVWLRFYRRAYLVACGLRFREGIVHEDIPWITEGDLRARRVVYVDDVLYEYSRHTESLTGRDDDRTLLARAESMFEVVAQLHDINRRCPMAERTRRLLRSEIVGQALNVDRLRRRIVDPALRSRLDARVRSERFWRSLWPDAVGFTRKRQLLQILWRETCGG